MRKVCKDCRAEAHDGLARTDRPAPHPGPRCATHHRQAKRAAAARAHDTRVQREYGLQAGEYGKLYRAQGGTCAICQRATGRGKRLAVDHDHETGEVRGLLCKTCNYDLIGKYDLAALRRACEYLLNPPARAVLAVNLNKLASSIEVKLDDIPARGDWAKRIAGLSSGSIEMSFDVDPALWPVKPAPQRFGFGS